MSQPPKKQEEKPKTGGLMITIKSAVKRAKRLIAIHGIEEARRMCDVENKVHEEDDEWPAIARAVNNVFIRERKKLEKEKARLLTISQNLNLMMKGNNLNYKELQ